MPDVKLSVVLPSYLEEENLRVLLPRLKDALRKTEPLHEVLVVDTVAPMDNTQEVCRQHGAIYLNRRGGNFFGDAVRTGIEGVNGEYVVFMDADGSHPPEFISELYRHADKNDVVVASRYVEGGYTENERVLVWMSRFLNWTYSFVLNLRCKDVSNSFKLYRSSLVKNIRLKCANFDVVEEILVRVTRNNQKLRIQEVPFVFKKRMFGKTKRSLVLFIMSYIVTLMKLRLSR